MATATETQTYLYKVRDRQGRMLEGTVEGESTTLVANKLRQMGYTPINIEKQGGAGLKTEISLFKGKPKLKDISVFSRQFATMINSGLSLLRSLYILEDQTENKALAEVISQIRQDVEKGASLSQAMAKHPKVFNKLYVSMVRSGEIGGVLDSVLLRLASTIEKQVELRGKVKSAMTYPVAVLALVLLILTAMLLFIVPIFKDLYDGLGGTLPLPTRMLLAVSTIMTKFFPIVVIAGVGASIGFRRWINTNTGREAWDALKLRVPIFGGLVQKTALTRFSSTLSALLRSGVPILESLEIVSDTVNNTVMAKAVRDVQTSVKGGESIAKPLGNHKIFPPMVVQMMAVGEETGALDEMLEKIGQFYEAEVEATVDALTSLLEPLLIVVLGGTVGGMVVSLYMPMFNIIKLIQ
ncbi:MAG TPA: type II secretion system F family protein [Acidimicrobiales bacterium]|jgi:type IV pilus assembly protein PilC|nr:type II secretion system F family protein [Acidimicrobiales bacterium]